jgi:hypothetical protein
VLADVGETHLGQKHCHAEPVTLARDGCGVNEQNAILKRYCHPSRELFRAGDLLFFHFIVRQENRSPAPLLEFRMASGIAAERGMTVIRLFHPHFRFSKQIGLASGEVPRKSAPGWALKGNDSPTAIPAGLWPAIG